MATISDDVLKQSNTVNLETLLNQNPQFTPQRGAASNDPSDGAATVNLRGLDSKRTLVLIDGKRAPYYDTTGSVDINSIPTALLKRVDVLTGGASAVYGSDAIAGVVNFVLDDKFEGFRFDGGAQTTQYLDGALYDASLTAGFKIGDRGHFVISGGYSKRQGVKFGARSHNSAALDSSDLVSSAGSSNTAPTAFDIPGIGRRQITGSGALSSDVGLYNYVPSNYAQLPYERYNVMALGSYELSDHVEFYARGSYSHVKVQQQQAPTVTSGFFFNIDPSNPFLTASERDAFFNVAANPGLQINDGSGVASDPTARAGTSVIGIRRRLVETSGRVTNYVTRNYQFVGGFKGDFGGSYHWDVSAQYGESNKHRDLLNDFSYSALKQALDVTTGPGGAAVCVDPSNGCVPLNLFTTGAIPSNQLAFVLHDGAEDTKITQFVLNGNLSGDLGFIQSPFAEKPAAFSIGAEYRRETGQTRVDVNFGSGDLIGFGQGQNVGGHYDVKELFSEVQVPIVQDKPWIRSLNVEGGVRFSDYSTVGNVWAYKGGGDYSPVDGIRFRGVYQRAVRAPNINELYSPVVAATGALTNDPCAGVSTDATTRAICAAQGAPGGVALSQPVSAQVNVFQGGNPSLQAEKSNTITLGVVINPPSMRRLSVTVDYFNIRIGNAIDYTPPSVTLNQCFVIDRNASSPACSSIHRNTLDGTLSGPISVGVPYQYGNIAVLKTSGVDLTVGYNGGDAEGFRYGINVAGTYTAHYQKQAQPGAPSVECAGYFGAACGIEPIPEWKHVATLTGGYKQFTLVGRWRYIGAVREDVGTNILLSRIPAFSYFDTTFIVEPKEGWQIRAGIQNMFNKQSPIVGMTVGANPVAGNTYPNTYDVLGRSFFLQTSFKF